MSAVVVDRVDFFPPAEHRTAKAYVLALLAHALLLAALTWGVNWRRQPELQTVEAELWANVPQQAAPKLQEPPPPPPPPPKPEVKPPPPPPPAPKVEARKPEPVAPDPQIAIEKERKRLEKLEQEKEKKEREELRKQEIAEQKRLEKERKELERQEREKKLAEEKAEKERLRQEEIAREKARQEAIAKAQAEAQRQANISRMAGLANATGGPTSVGTAQQSSGPSAGYGAKIRALLRPKIVFPDNLAGNPAAEVEVRTSPDGSVASRRLIRSSGVPSWDDAVLKAIDKTDRFPPDTDGDGKVPPVLQLTFRPKDF